MAEKIKRDVDRQISKTKFYIEDLSNVQVLIR